MTEKELRDKIFYHEEEIKKLKLLLKPFIEEKNKELLDFKKRSINVEFFNKLEIPDNGSIFWNKNIVITGKFYSYPNRNDLAKIIQENGAKIQSAISSRTDLVILGFDAGPSKIKQIETLNIKVINEENLINHINH